MPVPQKIRCKVTDVIDHGSQVYSLALSPEKQLPRFQAGQFLHLALDPYDPSGFWPDSRVFSIASSPIQRDSLRITYVVKGMFTTRMEKEIQPGREVWVKLPYGEFIISGQRDVVLVAGGTGITAFTAFLSGLNTSVAPAVKLFYGARSPELLIYRTLIEEKQKSAPQLQACYFMEQGQGQIHAENEIQGRLDAASIVAKAEPPGQWDYYLSGPPEMLSVIKQGLIHNRILENQIFVDAWS